jgi:hypothetical protein
MFIKSVTRYACLTHHGCPVDDVVSSLVAYYFNVLSRNNNINISLIDHMFPMMLREPLTYILKLYSKLIYCALWLYY